VPFDPSELRLYRQNKTVVYKVLGEANGVYRVVPIWRGDSAVEYGKEYETAEELLVAFDKTAFVAGR